MNSFPYFPRKRFQLRHSKICKKLKNALFRRSEHSFFSSRQLHNHFLRSFLWPNFVLNSFELFASLSQKLVSTSSLKNLQKTEKCPFQKLRTFGFYWVALKTFSEMLTMNHDQLWIQRLLNARLCFHSKRFQLHGSKMYKKTENCLFQRFSSTFTLDLKVVSKQFSRMFSMSDFGFTQSCLAFPKNIFNLFTEKCAKKSIFKRSEHLTSR